MKTIGILGGMSYESTLDYYRIINQEINKRLSGLHSAKILLESYDFSIIENLQKNGDWDKLASILIESSKKLENIGADYIAIATNTMHLLAPKVQENIKIPLIHIAQAVSDYIKTKGYTKVLLLGTKYTMTMPFYKDILKDNNINVITPVLSDQEKVNNIIYNELCLGIIKDESRNILLNIIDNYKSQGAQAAILGCTELPIILKKASIDLIDTTLVHCLKIVDSVLG